MDTHDDDGLGSVHGIGVAVAEAMRQVAYRRIVRRRYARDRTDFEAFN